VPGEEHGNAAGIFGLISRGPWLAPHINKEELCAAPPEALAQSPSQRPLSCPVAPPSQRELHKDGGGGGGGVARGARAARAPKAKSCAASCGTFSAAPCAASFACSSFMCYPRAGLGGACVRVAARRSISFLAPGFR